MGFDDQKRFHVWALDRGQWKIAASFNDLAGAIGALSTTADLLGVAFLVDDDGSEILAAKCPGDVNVRMLPFGCRTATEEEVIDLEQQCELPPNVEVR